MSSTTLILRDKLTILTKLYKQRVCHTDSVKVRTQGVNTATLIPRKLQTDTEGPELNSLQAAVRTYTVPGLSSAADAYV